MNYFKFKFLPDMRVLVVATTFSLIAHTLIFISPVSAQLSDEADLSSLKAELESSWGNSGSGAKAETESNSKISELEMEEQALLRKFSNDSETEKVKELKPTIDKSLIINEADEPEQIVKVAPSQKNQQEIKVAPIQKEDKVSLVASKSLEKNEEVNQIKIQPTQNLQKVSDLELRLRNKDKELQETRARLLLAETQVERLSSIIDRINKQKVAGFMSGAEPTRQIQESAPRVTQAVSSVSVQAKPDDTLVGIVSASKAHLRSGPSTNDSPIMTVSKGTRLVVETRNNEWYRIITPTGSRAWINSSMLKFGAGAEASSGSAVRISGYEEPKR
jgi:hypothetical protein